MATEFEIYTCPKCGKKYKVKSNLGKIKCSKCKDIYLTKKSLSFLHTADLHLGKYLCDIDLIEDQRYILREIVDIVKEKEVDGVILAGDIYDRAVPSEAAMGLLSDFLDELVKLKVRVFMISGNHDSDERLNYGSGLFEQNKIFISSEYDGTLVKHTMSDGDGELDIWLLPFIRASQVKRLFPDEDINSYNDAVRVVLNKAGIDPGRRNILIAHQFVSGRISAPKMSGSEGIETLNAGAMEIVRADMLAAFDYVALGHIHSPQSVERYEIRYAGSPIKYSLNEVNSDKSVTMITAGKKGAFAIETIPLRPLRDIRHIRGEMAALLAKENIMAPNDYMYITLTDEDIRPEAIGMFRKVYPNMVRLDYDNSHTRNLDKDSLDIKTEKRSFDKLITDFYTAMYGCDINDEEMKVMKEIAREAGVINEAG